VKELSAHSASVAQFGGGASDGLYTVCKSNENFRSICCVECTTE